MRRVTFETSYKIGRTKFKQQVHEFTDENTDAIKFRANALGWQIIKITKAPKIVKSALKRGDK